MSVTELSSYEPATGALYWKGPIGDVDAEVSIARENWADWAGKSITFRMEAMRRFANVVRGKTEQLTDCIARETGKPFWEARTEVESVINKVEISIASYSERTSQRRLEGNLGVKSALRHKPHGVLAVLGPYNFPVHLPNGHILPALLAGNSVVFKPSEKTPASGAMLVDCYHAAGIPNGALRLLIGGPVEGKKLSSHDGIDGLLFTGSARTGIMLSRTFADTPGKILALEMGGNNPIIVWDAADLHTAAIIVVQSAFLSAGQRCTAARRLIVRDGMHQQLIDEIRKLADRLIVGEPHSSPAPYMGPVIDNEVADGLQESLLALMMKGGQPIRQMERPMPDRPFLSPAIIDMTGVKNRPDVELFGPILQVIRVPDFDAAIIEANNTRYGLSASLIGGTPQLYDKFWANIRAGIVNWNRPTNGAPSNAPFGGVGLSGNHRPSAYYAADYCAYPVVSTEEENARASIGIGLRDILVNS
ncbi:MAG: succinylglutamate-semialdehyde dehydrogenase [Pseudomonadota bacterium]|jgi:succinylglutamic semialdehyde dehydrogenase